MVRSRFISESAVLVSEMELLLKERWQVCKAVTLAFVGKVQVLRWCKISERIVVCTEQDEHKVSIFFFCQELKRMTIGKALLNLSKVNHKKLYESFLWYAESQQDGESLLLILWLQCLDVQWTFLSQEDQECYW